MFYQKHWEELTKTLGRIEQKMRMFFKVDADE